MWCVGWTPLHDKTQHRVFNTREEAETFYNSVTRPEVFYKPVFLHRMTEIKRED